MMHSDIERTLANLHILSALSHNDKLATIDDSFTIYTPTSLRGIMRMWYGERRGQNVQRVRNTIRSAISIAQKSLEDCHALESNSTVGSESMCLRVETMALQHIRMLDGLRKAKGGLLNLLQTYRDDAAMSSQINLLTTEIEDFLSIIAPHSLALRNRCGVCVERAEIEHRIPQE